jgi:hypothetical protein
MTDEIEVDRGDNFEPTTDAAPAPVVAATDVVGDKDVTDVVGDLTDGAKETKEEADGTENSGDKGRFIPKDRFDEAVAKERTEKERVAAQLAELQKREADRAVAADMTKASAQIKDMIKEHTKMLADGELDQASALMGDILQLQSDMADYRSRAYADQGRTAAKSEMQYDAVVAKLEIEYPEINPDNVDVFDRDAVRKVQAYMTGLIQTENMSSSKALQEAVNTILGAKRANENQSEDAKRKAAEDLGMRRKEAAVTKAVAAQGKQPAALKDVGMDHDKTGGQLDAAAIMKLSWDEFIKLPDEHLAQMRGDVL